MLAGLAVIYAGGAAWLALLAGPSALGPLAAFVAVDLVKVAVAAARAAGCGARARPVALTAPVRVAV